MHNRVLAENSSHWPWRSPYFPVYWPRMPVISESSSCSFPEIVLTLYCAGTPACRRTFTSPETVLTCTASGVPTRSRNTSPDTPFEVSFMISPFAVRSPLTVFEVMFP